jgi:hypothetical protein
MSASTVKPPEPEQDRQQRVDELIAEHGSDWAEQYKPGSFGCHELLDRAAMTSDMVDQLILSHPACLQNAEWYALAEQASTALAELYQRVGAEHMGADGP